MKKILIFLAILGLFTLATPKIADAAETCYIHIMCGHYVVICAPYDYVFWDELYCGRSEE